MFIEAKDDGGGGHSWSYKSCKAPVKSSPPTWTNQHPVFVYRPDALPVANQQCQSTELSFIELCKYEQCIRTWQYLITVLMQSTHSCNILDTWASALTSCTLCITGLPYRATPQAGSPRNSLPLTVRDSALTFSVFCSRLKSELFKRAYCGYTAPSW